MSEENILREAMKNSKLRRFVKFENELDDNTINIPNSDNKYNPQVKEEINKRFQELRKKHLNLNVDTEAEEYIQKLRDIGEYNRWSLKLVQKWLTIFYNDRFWTNMSNSMIKYKHKLNAENISLEICNDFIEGYYLPSEKKIILCANTLTNFEKQKKFQNAMKRHLILMYDHIRSSNYDYNNCSHLACSEVRAAKLSGYCATSFNYLSVYSNQEKNMERNKSCVRNKATELVATYYDHCQNKASTYVNSVIEKCYYDDTPVKDLSREKNFMKFI